MINAFYPFHRYHWFQSSSMNFRIISTVLAVYLYFPYCFFMTYSILLRRFLDTFFSFLRATPLLPHLPMYSCDPLLSSIFRPRQLIVSTKNLRVLCTSRIFFFFFNFLYSRYYSSLSLFHSLSLLSFSTMACIPSFTFTSHSYYHYYYLEQLTGSSAKKSISIITFSHWISFLEKQLVIICFITPPKYLQRIFLYFLYFIYYFGLVVYLRILFLFTIYRTVSFFFPLYSVYR